MPYAPMLLVDIDVLIIAQGLCLDSFIQLSITEEYLSD